MRRCVRRDYKCAMRVGFWAVVLLVSACGSDKNELQAIALMCEACDANAHCIVDGDVGSCQCNEGYEGDGSSCVLFLDEARAACTIMQAEHPAYTSIARDVALCGGRYTAANIATACNTGWHVCLESEWLARYPTNRSNDLPAPETAHSIGQYTSWGEPQFFRCADVWLASAPDNVVDAWSSSVCYGGDGYTGSYNPYNNGKYLFGDDGTTILHGLNDQASQDCCEWDVTFAPTTDVDSFAVYCCRD